MQHLHWSEIFDVEIIGFYNKREGIMQELVLYLDKDTKEVIKWKIQR